MINSSDVSSPVKEPVVYVPEGENACRAALIAEKAGARIVHEPPSSDSASPTLCIENSGVSLVCSGQTLYGDFTRLLPRIKRGNLNSELLIKASRIKGDSGAVNALDATAGLGEDAFLLAAAGFYVELYERDPFIAALLEDALRRGAEQPETASVVSRMSFHEGDSITALRALETPPDIVLLDPMFPSRQKSALIKKKFQLLQRLESPCSDETELLDAALSCKPKKIVIKRPAKSPYLADRKPDYSLTGSTIRYDCILPAK